MWFPREHGKNTVSTYVRQDNPACQKSKYRGVTELSIEDRPLLLFVTLWYGTSEKPIR